MSSEDKAKLNAMLGLGEANAAQQPAEAEQPPYAEDDPNDELIQGDEETQATEPEAEEDEESGAPEIAALSEADLEKTVTLQDGREVSVGEAVAGYMRNDHHTQSLQQAAQTRQSYTQVMQMLGELEQAARAILEPDLQAFAQMNLDAMSYQDPQRYRQLKPAYDAVMQRKAQYDGMVQQIGHRLMQGVQAAEESAWKQVETDLSYAIAGFNDARFDKMKAYAEKVGFTADEVALMADPRIWRVMDKAVQFDELKSGKVSNKPKAKSRPSGQRTKGKATKQSDSRRQSELRRRARAGDKQANLQMLRGLVKI